MKYPLMGMPPPQLQQSATIPLRLGNPSPWRIKTSINKNDLVVLWFCDLMVWAFNNQTRQLNNKTTKQQNNKTTKQQNNLLMSHLNRQTDIHYRIYQEYKHQSQRE